jgi:hypothetical protein
MARRFPPQASGGGPGPGDSRPLAGAEEPRKHRAPLPFPPSLPSDQPGSSGLGAELTTDCSTVQSVGFVCRARWTNQRRLANSYARHVDPSKPLTSRHICWNQARPMIVAFVQTTRLLRKVNSTHDGGVRDGETSRHVFTVALHSGRIRPCLLLPSHDPLRIYKVNGGPITIKTHRTSVSPASEHGACHRRHRTRTCMPWLPSSLTALLARCSRVHVGIGDDSQHVTGGRS